MAPAFFIFKQSTKGAINGNSLHRIQVYSEETENKKEADNATGFTDYCAYCNCIYDFYPKRREVIND